MDSNYQDILSFGREILYVIEKNQIVVLEDVNIHHLLCFLYQCGFHNLMAIITPSLIKDVQSQLYSMLKIQPNAVDAAKIVSTSIDANNNFEDHSSIQLFTTFHFLNTACQNLFFLVKSSNTIIIDMKDFEDSDVSINFIMTYLNRIIRSHPNLKVVILADPIINIHNSTASIQNNNDIARIFPPNIDKQHIKLNLSKTKSDLNVYFLAEDLKPATHRLLNTLDKISDFETEGDILIVSSSSDMKIIKSEINSSTRLRQMPMLELNEGDQYFSSSVYDQRIILANQSLHHFFTQLRLIDHDIRFVIDTGTEGIIESIKTSKSSLNQRFNVILQNGAKDLKYFCLFNAKYYNLMNVKSAHQHRGLLIMYSSKLGINIRTDLKHAFDKVMVQSLASLKLQDLVTFNEDDLGEIKLTQKGESMSKFPALYPEASEINFNLLLTLVNSAKLDCFDEVAKIISIIIHFDYYTLKDILRLNGIVSIESDLITIINFFQVSIDVKGKCVRRSNDIGLREIFTRAHHLKDIQQFLKNKKPLIESSYKTYMKILDTYNKTTPNFQGQTVCDDPSTIIRCFLMSHYTNSGKITIHKEQPELRIECFKKSDKREYAIFSDKISANTYKENETIFWIGSMNFNGVYYVDLITKVEKRLIVDASSGYFDMK